MESVDVRVPFNVPFHPRVWLGFAAIALFYSDTRADNIFRKISATVVFLVLINQLVSNPHRWRISNG